MDFKRKDIIKLKNLCLNFDFDAIKEFFEKHNLIYDGWGYISDKPFHNLFYAHYNIPEEEKINISIEIEIKD